MKGRLLASLPFARSLFVFALVFAGVFLLHSSARADGLVECASNVGQCFVDALMGGFGKLIAIVLQLFVFLFGVLLGWAAGFFNFAMIVTVFQFATYFGNSAGLLLAWGILRDLANIMLLFGFIFIGIQTILNINHFSVGKALPTLIIFAILLNFSLFVAEAIIDSANAVAASFYAQAGNINCAADAAVEECVNQGLGGAIISATGVPTTLKEATDIGAIVTADSGMEAIVLYFGILMLFIALFFVLLAAAVMLVIRAITLVFVFVTAPIGFAGMAVPLFHEFAKEWWKRLINNALFAPVFVLLILVGLKVMEGVRGSLVGEDFSLTAALNDGGDTTGGLFVMFTLVIGFTVLALLSATRFGTFGSTQIVGWAMKGMGNTAGAFTVYPIGAGANALGKGYNATARAVRRYTPAPLKLLANVTGVGGVANALDRTVTGTLQAGQGLKLPLTGMDSYAEQQKKNKERSGGMASLDKELRDRQKAKVKEREEERMKKAAKKDTKTELKDALKEAKDTKDNSALRLVANGMSIEELKETDQVKNGADGVDEMAIALSASNFNKLMADPTVSRSVKDRMMKARYGDLQKRANVAIANGGDDLKKFMRDTDASDLRELKQFQESSPNNPDLQKMVKAIPAAKFKQFMEEREIPGTMRQTAKEARQIAIQTDIDAAVNSGNRDAVEKVVRETDIADLKETRQFKENNPTDTNGRRLMAQSMTVEKFKKFNGDTDNINSTVRERVRTERYEGLRSLVQTATTSGPGAKAAAKELAEKWTADDIQQSGMMDNPTERTELVRVMSDSQYEAVKRSESIGTNARGELDAIRNDPTNAASRFSPTNIAHTFDHVITKPEARAQIPAAVLMQPHVMERLTPADFAMLRKGNRLTDTQRIEVADYLQHAYNDPAIQPLHDELHAYEATMSASVPKSWAEFRRFYNL